MSKTIIPNHSIYTWIYDWILIVGLSDHKKNHDTCPQWLSRVKCQLAKIQFICLQKDHAINRSSRDNKL